MNIICRTIRRLRGLAIPSEVVCRPKRMRLKIFLRGDAIPISRLQIGEHSIQVARDFIAAVNSGTREWWKAENEQIHLADVVYISFVEETVTE